MGNDSTVLSIDADFFNSVDDIPVYSRRRTYWRDGFQILDVLGDRLGALAYFGFNVFFQYATSGLATLVAKKIRREKELGKRLKVVAAQ